MSTELKIDTNLDDNNNTNNNVEDRTVRVARNNKDDMMWESCCVKLDKRATIFFSQLCISLLSMTFCIYQMVHLTDCESQGLYSGIFTLILGVWLPQPSLTR
jgi:hypothetical protein